MNTTTVEQAAFGDFVERSEPQLRRALVASFGPHIGREAALDALSWGWEHWSKLQTMTNPVGYLYRVGQSMARRQLRSRPVELPDVASSIVDAVVTPELVPALARLSEQQRAAVVLVHGYAMSQRLAADVLGIAVSTLREHLTRGMDMKLTEVVDTLGPSMGRDSDDRTTTDSPSTATSCHLATC